MTKHPPHNPQSVASSGNDDRDSARAKDSGAPNELVPLDLPGSDCGAIESSVAGDRILRSQSRTAGRKAGEQQKRNQIPDLDFQFGTTQCSPVVQDNCVIARLAGAADILDHEPRSVKGLLDGPQPTGRALKAASQSIDVSDTYAYCTRQRNGGRSDRRTGFSQGRLQ
jgi:hypothetical protein